MDDKMNDVIDEVQKRLGEEYEVKRVEVMKNNDTKLKGIQVRRKDMNVAKICYWTSESVDEIVAVINRSLFPKFDCEINLEKLKEKQNRKKEKKQNGTKEQPTVQQTPKATPITEGCPVRIKGQSSVGEVLEINGKILWNRP